MRKQSSYEAAESKEMSKFQSMKAWLERENNQKLLTGENLPNVMIQKPQN